MPFLLLCLFLFSTVHCTSSFYPPSHRHLFQVQPESQPPKFTEHAENTQTARRVHYYAPVVQDIFSTEDDSIAYGGILGKGHIQDISRDTIQCVSVAERALRLVHLNVHDLKDILFCRRHYLRATNDHGKSGLDLPVQIRPSSGAQSQGGSKRTTMQVVEGINYFLQLELLNGLVHEITVNYDREGHYNVYHHTVKRDHRHWNTNNSATTTTAAMEVHPNADTLPPPLPPPPPPPPAPLELTVLTLNVWNTNPPGWSAGSNRQERYRQRIRLLASTINASKADIVGLQEVRYDSSIGSPGDHFQMKHLLDELGVGWYFTYNPSMNYFDASRHSRNGREEEGAAVLSRYPIVDTDFVLLPRFWDDDEDNQHQRQCIRARIQIDQGSKSSKEWGMVEVFTTHLSLSEKARDASVQEIWKYVQQTEDTATLQLLLGDLNAEPDTTAIQYLQGFVAMAPGEEAGALTKKKTRTNFQDAWLAAGHDEPESHSKDTQVQRHELTFPSDEPKKRIDLILFRDGGSAGSAGGGEGGKHYVSVIDTRLIGQDPLASTQHDPGHGMLDQDSPLWASDHRGVVSTFVHL
jgi:endonuclease/exonuclease/phosphatase family metal-dependent hydrolase